MSKDLIFSFPGYEELTQKLSQKGGFTPGELQIRYFPDGESYVRLLTDVKGRDVHVVCGLEYPNDKIMALLFFADVCRELGATSINLIAPYLGYMRQDIRFKEGEAVTSRTFAKLLSEHVDSLMTIDPHLHRYTSLDEIYTVPSKVLHATGPIANWIRENVQNPLLLGPDQESEQWVSKIATKIEAPYVILSKTRHGDREVEIAVPDLSAYKSHTPVLVDDVISTAQTMIQTVLKLKALGMPAPICIGVHGLFAETAYEDLQKSGVQQVVTCNTIPHPSNGIDISDIVVEGLKGMRP